MPRFSRLMLLVCAPLGVGCGPRIVAPECSAYVACQRAFDVATGVEAADVSAYAEDGNCWAGDPRTADRCAAECADAMDAVRAAADASGLEVAACAEDETA